MSPYFAANIPDLTKRELVMLITLVVFTVLFGVYPAPILDGRGLGGRGREARVVYLPLFFIYHLSYMKIGDPLRGETNFFIYKKISRLPFVQLGSDVFPSLVPL